MTELERRANEMRARHRAHDRRGGQRPSGRVAVVCRHPRGAVLRRRAGARPGRPAEGRPRPVLPGEGPCGAGSLRRARTGRLLPARGAFDPAQAGHAPAGPSRLQPAARAWRCPPGRSGRGSPSPPAAPRGLALDGQPRRRVRASGRRRVRGGPGVGGGHVRRPPRSGQPDRHRGPQRPADRRRAPSEVCDPGDLGAKFAAFGWDVAHRGRARHRGARGRAFGLQGRTAPGRPHAVIAHTVKGKGVSFMEDQAGWHGKAPNAEQLEAALAELVDACEKEACRG